MIREEKWRKELENLSDDELDDELLIPTDDWREDVLRETLRRILKLHKPKKDKGKLDFDEILKSDTSRKGTE